MTEFQIANPVLQAALFGNYYCENSKLKTNGYINNDTYKLARAFLSYCVEVIFNIRRLPGFEEEYRFIEGRHYFETFSVLDQDDVMAAISELKKLYEHTQKCLAQETNITNGKILLKRSLAFFERRHIAHQLLGMNEEIEYYSNVITSYKSVGELYEYGSPILLTKEVPIENILMHYKYLKYPGNSCSGESKEYEVLVINSSPFGREVINRSKFTYDESKFTRDEVKPEYKFGYHDQNRLQNIFVDLDTIEGTYCQSPFIKKMVKLQRMLASLRGR